MSDPKQKKLSVTYRPLEGQHFDVRPPANADRLGSGVGFGRFIAAGLLVFGLFAGLGMYNNGFELLTGSKQTAFAGFERFTAGLDALRDKDPEQAKALFASAERAFAELSDDMRPLTHQARQFRHANLYLDTADKLIEGSLAVSAMGKTVSELMTDMQSLPELIAAEGSLTDFLLARQDDWQALMLDAKRLQNNLASLNQKTLPASLAGNLENAREQVGVLLAVLLQVDRNVEAVLRLLGDETPHRYLVLLQNNHETRATGGFIGSYALVDVNDGRITKLEVEDVYRRDGQLSKVVSPPPGIDRVADRWYLRDANYSPDFPTSAKQILWFLDQSRGPTADTVIAIDQTVAEMLLRWVGPITLPGTSHTVTADNFNDLFSFNIEAKLSQTLTPKQLLIDFIPLVKEKLISKGAYARLLEHIHPLIPARHIQAYSTDPRVQALVEELSLDGRLIAAPDDTDFLAVVSTSIGGNKSDAYIKTKLEHHTIVKSNGEVFDQLTIQKTHTWTESDFKDWQKWADQYGTGKENLKTLRFIHGEGENMDYLRVYVPKGSLLTGLVGAELSDFQASDDLGYTVFALPFGPISPGRTQTLTLEYKLPHTLGFQPGDVYRFVAQKQAGAENTIFKKSLETADSLQIIQSYPVSASSPFTLYPSYQTAFDQNQIFLSAIAPVPGS